MKKAPYQLLCRMQNNECRESGLPPNCSCEHVHKEWMMLMTRPCVEARSDSGPVQTNNVTIWNRNGK